MSLLLQFKKAGSKPTSSGFAQLQFFACLSEKEQNPVV